MNAPGPDRERPATAPTPVTAARLARLEARARTAGHSVIRFDLAGCLDKAGLLARAAEAFRFPAWFGHNWDALSDSLQDLSWLDAPGYLVVLENAAHLETSAPATWRTLCEILEEVAANRSHDGVAWRTVRLAEGSKK